MLWACLHFPALALNLVEQGAAAPAPRVVEVSHRQRRLVLHANAAAREQGVVPGMTIPTAQGLVRDLQCRLYDPAAEQQALRGPSVGRSSTGHHHAQRVAVVGRQALGRR